eukprot:snap_masked-scaffold_12-processed-gene-12.39-mRNA-1 protein AED:0.32 eAED:0.33 QI:0/-1/0/1/-1/1/1/0/310
MVEKILTIQSHTTYSFVGNNCCVLALQILGYHPLAINSLNFSNHTGYDFFGGSRTSVSEFLDIFNGLKRNDLLRSVKTMLLGYIGTTELLTAVGDVLDELRKLHGHDLLVQCDPVMGDNGKFYVSKEIVSLYISRIIPFSTIITPNLFELQQIMKTQDHEYVDFSTCANFLHQKYDNLRVIIQTSTTFIAKNKFSSLFCSLMQGSKIEVFEIQFPIVDGLYTGTGDLFSSIFLAKYKQKKLLTLEKLKQSVKETLATVLFVVQETKKEVDAGNNPEKELCLIECLNYIKTPPEDILNSLTAVNLNLHTKK